MATLADRASILSLALCGDVMTGRGIDQVLRHPGNPRLYEPAMTSALQYVELAEQANGPIARPVDESYIWGDALDELARAQPDLRIVNLETSVTRSAWPAQKPIHYKMHPENVGCLSAAGIDCCVLANNHVRDWGVDGLLETLDVLHASGIETAGAGRNVEDALCPAILPGNGKGRVLVFGFGFETGGIPHWWAAGSKRPGVALAHDLSGHTVDGIAHLVDAVRQPGDLVLASLHWGGNWGYEIPEEQRAFAQALIDHAGVDLVHGHSSHHPKGIEVYRGKAIFYGCGDFLNDYEGIPGHAEFRGSLALLYLPSLARDDGALCALRIVPFRIAQFRLNRASDEEARWLHDMLNREGRALGTQVSLTEDNSLMLRWGNGPPA